jgi:dihydrofolate synthase/folylpolyglutamate synthase
MMFDSAVPPFLLSAQKFGIRLGLERMISLMSLLGNPQDGMRVVHVAGTNGKGSVVAYISAMLASEGYKVGVYTSPFLERFSERIRILDGEESLMQLKAEESHGEIGQKDLFDLSEKVRMAVLQMTSLGQEHPTEFELVTAVAFLYFRQENCEYVVLETGLGGRLDSTNIIPDPVCSIITAIGYDHTDRLGETVAQIASEKAGIIKFRCPVYLMSPSDTDLNFEDAYAVERVIVEKCAELIAPLTIVSSSDILLRNPDSSGQKISLSYLNDPVNIGLIGRHQALNAALSVRSVMNFISERSIREGLSKTVWKGRIEIVRQNPLVILDGAHNPQGMKSFCEAMNETYAETFRLNPPRLILGVMKDKEYEQMLRILFSSLSFDLRELICVTVDQERTLDADVLAEAAGIAAVDAKKFYNVTSSMYNIQVKISAYDNAIRCSTEMLSRSLLDTAPILCIGSLYLIGQIRDIFVMSHEGD